jgi:hypothetical protein
LFKRRPELRASTATRPQQASSRRLSAGRSAEPSSTDGSEARHRPIRARHRRSSGNVRAVEERLAEFHETSAEEIRSAIWRNFATLMSGARCGQLLPRGIRRRAPGELTELAASGDRRVFASAARAIAFTPHRCLSRRPLCNERARQRASDECLARTGSVRRRETVSLGKDYRTPGRPAVS